MRSSDAMLPLSGRGTSRGWLLLAVLAGLASWVLLWQLHDVHASWDALFYHRFAAEYAGATTLGQDEYAWSSAQDHFAPSYRAWLIENGSWPWQGWDDPMRERWIEQYRMRPLYPLLVALFIPMAGTQSPVLVSLLATVAFVSGMLWTVGRLLGHWPSVLFVALCLATPSFATWLVFMQTDSMALALYAVSLGLTATYVRSGGPFALGTIALMSGMLAFTRPLAVVLPLGLSVALLLMAQSLPRRRVAATIVAASIPVLGFLVWSVFAGWPGFFDLLQDLPTRHFSKPDVVNPLGYAISTFVGQVGRDFIPTMLRDPLPIVAALLAAAGFLWARPGAWAIPFLTVVPFVMGTYVIHPSIAEAERTLAPIWLSIHLGIALLMSKVSTLWGSTAPGVGYEDGCAAPADPGGENLVRAIPSQRRSPGPTR